MTQPSQIPGYTVGRWTIDPVHSDVSFTVRHLVSKVRGRFRTLEGTVVTAENPLDSSITVSIDPNSIDTGNEQRDGHLKSADFLEVEKYPKLTFTSTGIRQNGDDYLIEGDLTIKDVTRSVTADLELGGFAPAQDGVPHAGFTASFEIDRNDYNVTFSAILETGGVMVGDKIQIQIEIEAILDQD